MIKYCREHPELTVISLIPTDGYGWCECERCSVLLDLLDNEIMMEEIFEYYQVESFKYLLYHHAL